MIWKQVKGFETLYEVSDTGLLRNIKRNTLVKATFINSGYALYRLYNNTVCTHKLAHVLVAETYIPNPENKRTVNHKDCNKCNNHVENLEWMTHGENHKHAFEHGRQNPNAFELGVNKVSAEEVRWIRQHYIKGDRTYGASPLAHKFNMSTPCLLKIVRKQSYKSVL